MIRPTKGYHNNKNTSTDAAAADEDRESYGFRSLAKAVRTKLPLSQYCADNDMEVRCSGAQLVVLSCPHHSPDRVQTTPSFTIFGDRTYHCFACCEWGDVVSLHAYLDNHKSQWTALLDLAQKYGIELPQRPKKWFDWQREKGRRREAIKRRRAEFFQRQYYRLFFKDLVDAIADPAEREREADRRWRQLWPLAWSCAEWKGIQE